MPQRVLTRAERYQSELCARIDLVVRRLNRPVAGLARFAAWLAFLLAGCASFGPSTVRDQQVDYAAAVADAGKRQMLLNIVKLRYGDVPAFLSISQILAGYSIQGTFSTGTKLLTGRSFQLGDEANVGVGGTYTNSPTIAYRPVTGVEFARTFLAPMPPADLFGLVLAGVPAELVFGLGLHSIGGYDNELSTPLAQKPANPGFAAVLSLFLELQQTGRMAVSLAVGDRERVASVRLGKGEGEQSPEARLRKLLHLPADRDTFAIVYTLGIAQPGQIAIRTRSLIEMLSQLAGDIEVPGDEVAAGRAYSRPPRSNGGQSAMLAVRHARFEPRDAFVAVRYDDDWFWIANADLATKRLFSFVMLLLSLGESSTPGQPPVLTIPAG